MKRYVMTLATAFLSLISVLPAFGPASISGTLVACRPLCERSGSSCIWMS